MIKLLQKNVIIELSHFQKKNKINSDSFKEKISLLLDPQTCGPLLICCDPKYEKFLKDEWYKVGEVIN